MRRPRWIRVPLALGVLVASGACSSGPLPADATADQAARRFGSCAHPGADWSGTVGLLSSAERWVEVVGSGPALHDGAAEAPERHVVLPLLVRAYRHGAGDVGPAHTERLAVYGRSLPGIEWAMRAGAHAYIALSSTGLERELEDYVLVRHPDGSWFFSNDCGFDLLTQPMRDRLGDDYGPTIEDVLGRTRNGVVRALHAHGFDE